MVVYCYRPGAGCAGYLADLQSIGLVVVEQPDHGMWHLITSTAFGLCSHFRGYTLLSGRIYDVCNISVTLK